MKKYEGGKEGRNGRRERKGNETKYEEEMKKENRNN